MEKDNQNIIKEFWNWLWNSESWWSYLVFLVIIFILVKFILLPGLGFIMGTSLPLAIVESGSMEHYSIAEGNTKYVLCGQLFNSKEFFSLEQYWQVCGNWYESKNITKEQFSSFKFKNGFRKGDLMIIISKKPENIKIGDVLVFNAGRNHPIIHRVIATNPFQTKGDHNNGQIIPQFDPVYSTDETNIKENQIIGVAVAKIPYLGWIKLFFVELLSKLM